MNMRSRGYWFIPMITVILGGVLFPLFATLHAETNSRQDLPSESREFDFWLGTWNVDLRIRQEDGNWPVKVQAEARIYPVLDRKAVLELWKSGPILGMSLRYYDPDAGEWKLWLNWPQQNRSGSSGLSGRFHHGRGEFFSRRTADDGSERISRYTFSDITSNRLRWDDAYSQDGGKTWTHQWIMEFTRTGASPTLDPTGGKAHTWTTGERCTLEQFRKFETLTGKRSGTVEWLSANGESEGVPATLTGWYILDGCAVLSEFVTTRNGQPYRRLYMHTWNTYASMFEETSLDSLAKTSLNVAYGQLQDHVVELVTHSVEALTDRSLWRIHNDSIKLERQTSPDGEAWTTTERWHFPRSEEVPKRK